MNIKGLIPNTLDIRETRSVSSVEKPIKSDESHDRDANGQETYNQQEQKHPPMTEEQLQKAIEHLKNLPACKEHKWTIQLETIATDRFVLVKDNLGNIIRRIPENELWTLPSSDSPRGQLIKRSA